MSVRNRSAQDATLINLRALKKRVQTLERLRKDDRRRIDLLERGHSFLNAQLTKLLKSEK